MDEQVAPKRSKVKTLAYFVAMAVIAGVITFIIANDITVSNYQAKFASMVGTPVAALQTYDATTVAGGEVCADIAAKAGRIIAKVQVLPGFRPQNESEGAALKTTDTFICFFTSGETIPFMITYVGGEIVGVQ